MKTCIVCKELLCLSSYHKDKSRSDGLNPRCKTCKRSIDVEYRKSHIDSIKKNQKEYYDVNSDAIKKRSNLWYEANKDLHSARMKTYFQENKVKIKLKQHEWNLANEEKMKQYMNNYIKSRYSNDLNYKVKSILSARIRGCVKWKSKSTESMLGCTIDRFLEWIEYQFDSNMTWENCGQYWHFDHVIPCSSFDLSNKDEVDICFNWQNIRPLEARENLVKSNKKCDDIINKHKQIVNQFIERTKEHKKLCSGGD